jgi:hypothetical protein
LCFPASAPLGIDSLNTRQQDFVLPSAFPS